MVDNLDAYVSILLEGLQKKQAILNEISTWNKEQEQLLQMEELDLEAFDHTVEEKEVLLKEMTQLDTGFEATYERVKEPLETNKADYIDQINEMKHLISQIMDCSVTIQASEARNKSKLESHFITERKKIKQKRISQKVAMNYYRNYSRINYIDPQLMDKKK